MEHVINWLLTGDVAMQCLTCKRLLHSGSEILAPLQPGSSPKAMGLASWLPTVQTGTGGCWFYQPKWTCTHDTLLDLKEIDLPGEGRTRLR